MIFLLPPSETKRDGGVEGSRLDFSRLSFPGLDRPRRSVAAALVRLSRDVDASVAALKIGPRLCHEVVRNRDVKKSPTLRALERYTGVAYDPIKASELSPDAWRWAAEHVAIHSALFGVVSATDAIPAYRLSHNSRIPGFALRSHWSAPVARVLCGLETPIVDLRSESYVELGAAPPGSAYVRVVSDDGGQRRALNHFNKKTKGALVARLLADRPLLSGIDDFVDWARAQGVVVSRHASELVVISESVLGDGGASL